ncbi:hypothetical protein [Streptomyces sp. ME18-1-4]|uniref:hypothetical protein n=1 Tax=Streptomyces sp. ME18-1-4 TaxID=3028685 RepID=UPI0029BEC6C3|nr:hypothetical protein [Streptomyces sp. ME18-1-4]MDX3245468.1 hypothetical protein [Streptomyces sp. ME18-1-4]
MTASRRWRAALASAASTVILIGAPLIGAQTASAQPYPPPPPPLSVSATTVTAGAQLTFSSTSGVFTAGANVTALLESTPVVLGRFRARLDGSVAGTVTIPARTVTGWHVFRLTSNHPDASLGTTIYVLGVTLPTPPHKPPHHPAKSAHHQEPGHSERVGQGGSRAASHELAAAVEPVDYPQRDVEPANHPQPDQDTKKLAATGSHQALVIGGIASALLVAGGGTMLAARRRRHS